MRHHYWTGDGLLNHAVLIIFKLFYCSRGQDLEETEIMGVRIENDRYFFRSNLYTSPTYQWQA